MHERPPAKPNRLLLISFSAVVLVFGIVLFAGGSVTARAVPRRQNALADLTDTADAQTSDAEDTADAKTSAAEDTAFAQTDAVEQTAAAQSGTPMPTSTATSTGTTARTSTSVSRGTATLAGTTVLRTPASPTPSLSVPSPASRPTPITPANPVPTLVGSVPPTATPLVADALACPAGVPVLLRGNGPPHAAFLLFFGNRAVGGGSVEADGTFTARLVVGDERAGDYPVVVRLRGTPRVLLQRTCAVPAITPTMQPRRAVGG
jgi:hypothetical protein